jgi:hypothetical protein
MIEYAIVFILIHGYWIIQETFVQCTDAFVCSLVHCNILFLYILMIVCYNFILFHVHWIIQETFVEYIDAFVCNLVHFNILFYRLVHFEDTILQFICTLS